MTPSCTPRIALVLLAALLPRASSAADAGAAGSPAAGSQPARIESKVIVLKGDGGDAGDHELRVVARDGHVTIDGEADPDRAWLGIVMADEEHGARVTAVVKDSPADKAGIRVGDEIVRIGSRDVAGTDDVTSAVRDRKPGDRIDVAVKRDGKTVSADATLAGHPATMEMDLPEDGAFAWAHAGLEGLPARLRSLKDLPDVLCLGRKAKDADCNAFSFLRASSGPRLGVVVESMPAQLAEYFGVDADRGVLVKEVVENGAAAKAGLKAGDVILRVGERDVRRVGDIRDALHDVKKGDTVGVEALRRGTRQSFTIEVTEDAADEDGPASWSFEGMPGSVRAFRLDSGDDESLDNLDDVLGQYEVARIRAEIAKAKAQCEALKSQAKDSARQPAAGDGPARQREREIQRQRHPGGGGREL